MSAHDWLLPADAMDVGQPTDDQLTEWLALDDDEVAAPRWYPTDDGGAEWAMRKLAAAEADYQTMDAERQRMVDEIEAWFARRTAETVRARTMFTAMLVRYGEDQHTEHKRKTIDLPSGKVATVDRSDTASIEVTDATIAAAWIAENLPAEEAAEVTPPVPPKVLVSKFASVKPVKVDDEWRILDANGEQVPGLGPKLGECTTKAKVR